MHRSGTTVDGRLACGSTHASSYSVRINWVHLRQGRSSKAEEDVSTSNWGWFLSDLVFRRILEVYLQGMELLSTALWHLQDAHELSSLAQHLTTEARSRPQTWCVAGNCFSLQRQVTSFTRWRLRYCGVERFSFQHAKAVDCMERAIQLDPYFAYAYTLLGHELIFQEEYDRAANAFRWFVHVYASDAFRHPPTFRRALEISPKDYRAWHGLGLVHLRKEQMGLAQVFSVFIFGLYQIWWWCYSFAPVQASLS